MLEQRKSGKKVTLPHHLLLLIEYDQFLITDQDLSPLNSKEEFPSLHPSPSLPVIIPGVTLMPAIGWQLRATILSKTELKADQYITANPWEAYLDATIVGPNPRLRVRQSGDRFAPLGLHGRQKKDKIIYD